MITQEFNCNANVHKRETITLKRAWDNMKAFTRKARATERGNLIRTGGGPFPSPLPPQQGVIITMVEEAAPNMICEVKNNFDSDGIILNSTKESQESVLSSDTTDFTDDVHDGFVVNVDTNLPEPNLEEQQINDEEDQDLLCATLPQTEQRARKPSDYIRREALIRIKSLEIKKKMQMQILKEKLEVQKIKKRASLLEEEKNKILLKKAQVELEQLENLKN